MLEARQLFEPLNSEHSDAFNRMGFLEQELDARRSYIQQIGQRGFNHASRDELDQVLRYETESVEFLKEYLNLRHKLTGPLEETQQSH